MTQILSPQLELFQQIKAKMAPDVSFVHEISDLLNLSYDSTYRRIRGEKEISIAEMEKLCKHFAISADALFKISAKSVIFSYRALEDRFSLEQWLETLLNDIQGIHNANEKKVIYSASEVPVFHYFQFPEITAFKEFVWKKTMLDVDINNHQKFSIDEASKEIFNLGRKILATAVKVPTIEIWNEETFYSTLRQVEYYWASGYFKSENDIHLLVEALEKWLFHIKDQAERGYKFIYGNDSPGIDGNFKLYYNDFFVGGNSISVSLENSKISYLTYQVLNLLITNNQHFCEQLEESMEMLIRKSVMISSVSARERNIYFKQQFDRLDEFKTRNNL